MLLKRLWPGMMAAAPLQQSLTHTTSLCIVPPDASPEWRAVQATRLEMRDAGIYRWPPHCNLIYPFAAKPRLAAVDVRRACATVKPFRLRLTAYGTFGGAKRGVLWLRPDVVGGDAESLSTLQSTLCATLGYETPAARKRSLPFVPHFTLAHFDSLAAAAAAGDALTFEPVEFDVDAVHLLEREGHGGQFEVVEKVPLGRAPLWRLRRLFRRKRRFRGMPATPPDWVADAMAERSSRRFRGRGKRRRKRRSAAERAEIAARTPEDIAAIRAERAAKRRAKEAGEASSEIDSSSDV